MNIPLFAILSPLAIRAMKCFLILVRGKNLPLTENYGSSWPRLQKYMHF